MARPRLAVRNTSVPSSRTNGWASTWWSRSAIANTALLPATCSERITNSSPPKRAIVSSGRTIERSRSAKLTRSWSPAPWPRLSLTTLNRSRSRKRTATSSLSCRARHERVLEPVEHQGAVGQAGQLVVDGLVGQAALGFVALERDLEQLPGRADRVPLVGVGLARFGVVHRDRAELPAAVGHVEHRQRPGGPQPGRLEGGAHRRHQRIGAGVGHDDRRTGAERLAVDVGTVGHADAEVLEHAAGRWRPPRGTSRSPSTRNTPTTPSLTRSVTIAEMAMQRLVERCAAGDQLEHPGLGPQQRARPARLGDVGARHHDAVDVGVVQQVHRGDRDDLPLAVGVAEPELRGVLLARMDRDVLEQRAEAVDVVGMAHVEDVPVVPERDRVTEHRLGLAAREQDAALGVDDADRVGDVLDERAEAVLARDELGLGRLPLGDVGERGEHAGRRAGRSVQQRGPQAEVEGPAVAVGHRDVPERERPVRRRHEIGRPRRVGGRERGRAPEDLLERPPEHQLRLRVPELDEPVEVGDADGERCVRHDRVELRVGRPAARPRPRG